MADFIARRPRSAVARPSHVMLVALVVAVTIGGAGIAAQSGPASNEKQLVPGRNVNMVGGPIVFKINPPAPVSIDQGDPFLQRQNEPSCAVMNRNPLRIFCGANDYRTVDLPGLPEDKLTGDAWLGEFWSTNGGDTFSNSLVPGFPQDSSPQGLASPIHGLQAAADATLRTGPGDMVYYSGIAFNRGATNSSAGGVEGKKGVLFVARYNHPNLPNDPRPIKYLDTKIVDNGSSGRFLDKPWLAVGLPTATSGTCNIQVPGATSQSIPAGPVFIAYTIFVGNDENVRSKIYIARSLDCGATFNPTKLSEGFPLGQGVSIGIDSRTGWVYVVWRQLRVNTQNDGLLYVVSKDGGATYTKPATLISLPQIPASDGSMLSPFFDQGSTEISMRTLAFPSIAVGDSGVNGQPGPVYVTWSQRFPQVQNGLPISDARLMLAVGTPAADTVNWSAPFPVHNPPDFRGHQIQPAAAVVEGRLTIAFLNVQEDHTAGVFTPVIAMGPDGVPALLYSESRELAGNLAPPPGEPEKVFTDFLADRAQDANGQFTLPLKRRHTVDTWLSYADDPLGASALFTTVRVSQYPFGTKNGRLEQLQYSPPNFKLFSQGSVAFLGDYIDIGRQQFRRDATGKLVHNTAKTPLKSPFYITWTDNRDIRPPSDGDWTKYTPPVWPQLGGTSIFDPTQTQPACNPLKGSRAGMRDQNVYASRITEGLFLSSLTNQKPLKTTTVTDDGVTLKVDQHVFPWRIDNETNHTKTFRVVVSPDPTAPDPTAVASFDQFSVVTELDLKIFRRSSASRNLFVRATNPKAAFKIEAVEIADIGAPNPDPTADVLRASMLLNPDPTAPDPTAPDPTAPDPTAIEVYTIDLTTPDPTAANVDVSNSVVPSPDPTAPDPTADAVKFPDPTAPDPTAPDPTAPDPTAPDPTAKDVAQPDVTAPDPTAPDPTAPDPTATATTDSVFQVKNKGTNAASYKVKLFVNKALPPGFRLQLIVNSFQGTAAVKGCEPATKQNANIIANIPNPVVLTDATDLSTPDPTATGAEDASVMLGPGQIAFVTVRMFDPDRKDNVTQTITQNGVTRTITFDPDFNAAEEVETAVIPPVDNADEAKGITVAQIATSFLFISTSALSSGTTGQAYTGALTASGGSGALTWSIISGGLPTGLALNPATGAISGTPTAAGTFTFIVQVQDSAVPTAQIDTQELSIAILTGGAASLAFVQQPIDTKMGQVISPPVTVRAINGAGAAVAGVPVTMTIGSNPGGGTLSGTTTVQTGSNGVAVFTTLSINTAGQGYTLNAAAGGFASATSAPFDIIGPPPDLVVEQLTHSPASPTSADTITFTAVVKNLGPGAANVSTLMFKVGGETPGDPATLFAIPALAPGASFTVQRQATLTAQNYINTATADFANVLLEANEANNTTTDAYTVTPPPDLVVDQLTHSPASPTAADAITFTAVVKNLGLGAAPASTLMFKIGGETAGAPQTLFAVPALAAGATFTVQRQDTLPAQNYLNTATADFNGNVVESDESNNTTVDAYTVSAVLVGKLRDTIGDAAAGEPDLLSASVTTQGANLLLSVRFAPGTFSSTTSVAQFSLDTDENAATGHQGTDSGCVNDNGVIGTEFIVDIGSTFNGTQATVRPFTGPSCNQFGGATATGSVVYVANGMDVTIPLSAIGGDDGRLRFKVISFRFLGGGAFTGVQDRMTDVGLPPGKVPGPIYTGSLTDPSGDAASGEPDLVSAVVDVRDGNLELSVRFAPGSFSASTSVAQFSLDTDENAATGHQGTDSGCVGDNGVIGTEFIVDVGSTFNGSQATVRPFTGPSCNQFGGATAVGSVVYLANGMDVTIPLSAIGGDEGRLRFKVITSRFLGGGSFTGIQDRMTNVGLPPGSVQPIPISGSLVDPSGDVAAGEPDLVSASVKVQGGKLLQLSVRFAAGSFSASTSVAQFSLDTDENAATGHQGTDSGCVNDNGVIGTEFIVDVGSTFNGNVAKVRPFIGPACNQFGGVTTTGSVVYVADGLDVTIPLSAIGNDDGRLRFKVTSFRFLGGGSFTSVRDRMTDAGRAAGQVLDP